MELKRQLAQKKEILTVLTLQKAKLARNVYAIQAAINSREASVEKFMRYYHEYQEKMGKQKIQTILLIQQADTFLNYIQQLVNTQKEEILTLTLRKKPAMEKYYALLEKIEAMDALIRQLEQMCALQEEKKGDEDLITVIMNKKRQTHG